MYANAMPRQGYSLSHAAALLLMLSFCSLVRAETYHVDGVAGNDNLLGTSWAQAFKTLQKAIDAARNNTATPHQIWVTAGTYYPDVGPGAVNSNDPAATFEMLQLVSILGGFQNGDDLEDRDPIGNETILSGDITNNDLHSPAMSPGDIVGTNSSHVLTYVEDPLTPGLNPTAVLDGFTVTAGNANAADQPGFLDDIGRMGGGAALDGGVFIQEPDMGPTFRDCTFIGNRANGPGGAVGGRGIGVTMVNCAFEHNEAGDAPVEVQRGGGAVSVSGDMDAVQCTFVANAAADRGGAAEDTGAGPDGVRIVNCKFLENEAGSRGGGAFLEIRAEKGYMVNCLFAGNVALGSGSVGGGGLFSFETPVINCTFVSNQALGSGAAGGGANMEGAAKNSIFWANVASGASDWTAQLEGDPCPDYCNIQDFTSAECGTCFSPECDGMIGADPRFIDADGPDDDPGTFVDNDYRLCGYSPSVETGGPGFIPVDIFDLDHDSDPDEATPDLNLNVRVRDSFGGTGAWWTWGPTRSHSASMTAAGPTSHRMRSMLLISSRCSVNLA